MVLDVDPDVPGRVWVSARFRLRPTISTGRRSSGTRGRGVLPLPRRRLLRRPSPDSPRRVAVPEEEYPEDVGPRPSSVVVLRTLVVAQVPHTCSLTDSRCSRSIYPRSRTLGAQGPHTLVHAGTVTHTRTHPPSDTLALPLAHLHTRTHRLTLPCTLTYPLPLVRTLTHLDSQIPSYCHTLKH